MDGRPEGTQPRRGSRRPRWLMLLVLVFAVYLSIRLIQGVVWLIGLM